VTDDDLASIRADPRYAELIRGVGPTEPRRDGGGGLAGAGVAL